MKTCSKYLVLALLSCHCGGNTAADTKSDPPLPIAADPKSCGRLDETWPSQELGPGPEKGFGRWRLWGSGVKNAYAVGPSETAMYRFDGAKWEPSKGVGIEGWYSWDLVGTGAADVWVSATAGLVRRFDGDSWETESEAPLGRPALWSGGPGRLVAVGDAGKIARLADSQWNVEASPTSSNLRGVSGTDSDDVFAVGENVALHFDGVSWSLIPGEMGKLNRVWALARDEAIAIGEDGAGLVRLSPSGITERLKFPCPDTGTDIWATGPNDIFAVGGMCLAHFDGEQWIHIHPGGFEWLFAVWGLSAHDVFVAGTNRIYHCKR